MFVNHSHTQTHGPFLHFISYFISDIFSLIRVKQNGQTIENVYNLKTFVMLWLNCNRKWKTIEAYTSRQEKKEETNKHISITPVNVKYPSMANFHKWRDYFHKIDWQGEFGTAKLIFPRILFNARDELDKWFM